MVDYVELQAVVVALIEDAGKIISVQKLNTVAVDPAKPWRGPADNRSPYAASENVPAVAVPVSGIGKLIDKKSIPDNITDCYIVAPFMATPDLSDFDEIVDEGTTIKIDYMYRLRPANVTLLYVIGVVK